MSDLGVFGLEVLLDPVHLTAEAVNHALAVLEHKLLGVRLVAGRFHPLQDVGQVLAAEIKPR